MTATSLIVLSYKGNASSTRSSISAINSIRSDISAEILKDAESAFLRWNHPLFSIRLKLIFNKIEQSSFKSPIKDMLRQAAIVSEEVRDTHYTFYHGLSVANGVFNFVKTALCHEQYHFNPNGRAFSFMPTLPKLQSLTAVRKSVAFHDDAYREIVAVTPFLLDDSGTESAGGFISSNMNMRHTPKLDNCVQLFEEYFGSKKDGHAGEYGERLLKLLQEKHQTSREGILVVLSPPKDLVTRHPDYQPVYRSHAYGLPCDCEDNSHDQEIADHFQNTFEAKICKHGAPLQYRIITTAEVRLRTLSQIIMPQALATQSIAAWVNHAIATKKTIINQTCRKWIRCANIARMAECSIVPNTRLAPLIARSALNLRAISSSSYRVKILEEIDKQTFAPFVKDLLRKAVIMGDAFRDTHYTFYKNLSVANGIYNAARTKLRHGPHPSISCAHVLPWHELSFVSHLPSFQSQEEIQKEGGLETFENALMTTPFLFHKLDDSDSIYFGPVPKDKTAPTLDECVKLFTEYTPGRFETQTHELGQKLYDLLQMQQTQRGATVPFWESTDDSCNEGMLAVFSLPKNLVLKERGKQVVYRSHIYGIPCNCDDPTHDRQIAENIQKTSILKTCKTQADTPLRYCILLTKEVRSRMLSKIFDCAPYAITAAWQTKVDEIVSQAFDLQKSVSL